MKSLHYFKTITETYGMLEVELLHIGYMITRVRCHKNKFSFRNTGIPS